MFNTYTSVKWESYFQMPLIIHENVRFKIRNKNDTTRENYNFFFVEFMDDMVAVSSGCCSVLPSRREQRDLENVLRRKWVASCARWTLSEQIFSRRIDCYYNIISFVSFFLQVNSRYSSSSSSVENRILTHSSTYM